ncbi:EutN/CcmL family microcompartment protein [bacterium]|nr:EutN/CcmL family microcompartment protein [candidate division CSSED10-310 bacterium]
MFVGKVVGRVWATSKLPSLIGYRLLLVRPVQGVDLEPAGKVTMAVCDQIDAGVGDVVLVLDEGGSARQILGRDDAPVRTIVVGVVDTITLAGESRRLH